MKCRGNNKIIIIILFFILILTTLNAISVLMTAVTATVINFIFAPIVARVTTTPFSCATEKVRAKKAKPNWIEIQMQFLVVLPQQVHPSPPEGLLTVISHSAFNPSKKMVVGSFFSCSTFEFRAYK